MKKFVIAHSYIDGDLHINFRNGENKYEVLKEFAKEYGFDPADTANYTDLTELFYEGDQAAVIEEIPE